jgi:uncharacterized protein (DUF2141 family)
LEGNYSSYSAFIAYDFGGHDMDRSIQKLWLIGLTGAIAMPAVACDLTVELRDLTPNMGRVIVAIYDHAQDFPIPERRLALQSVTVDKDAATVVFRALHPNRYAVAAYQDANNNGRLDRNLFGVPTEHYGFSNDARALMGPPSFEAAAVDVFKDTQLHITLH